MAPKRQLWSVEGIPGSGKSITAERLNDDCASRRQAARWWLEELRDHPVVPAALRGAAAEPDFPNRCLEVFRAFLTREDGVLILDGAAMQSTIRFMFANRREVEEIADYFDRWSVLVEPMAPRLVFLDIDDPERHYLDFLIPLRGAEWTDKLVRYVEGTPVARANAWQGIDGLIRFWSAYQDLCREMLSRFPAPVLVFPADPSRDNGLDPAIHEFFGLGPLVSPESVD
ncbi:MAG: hypothetical protein Q8L23_01150 [Caulobacter sp.]|nr:hypothetical protein [Caulobacter sp.]